MTGESGGFRRRPSTQSFHVSEPNAPQIFLWCLKGLQVRGLRRSGGQLLSSPFYARPGKLCSVNRGICWWQQDSYFEVESWTWIADEGRLPCLCSCAPWPHHKRQLTQGPAPAPLSPASDHVALRVPLLARPGGYTFISVVGTRQVLCDQHFLESCMYLPALTQVNCD